MIAPRRWIENDRAQIAGDEDACSASDATDDPASGVSIQSLTVGAEEDGPGAALADRQVDGAGDPRREWHRDGPRLSMLIPTASETRSPFNANRETRL
jgi:hypothetical protein